MKEGFSDATAYSAVAKVKKFCSDPIVASSGGKSSGWGVMLYELLGRGDFQIYCRQKVMSDPEASQEAHHCVFMPSDDSGADAGLRCVHGMVCPRGFGQEQIK